MQISIDRIVLTAILRTGFYIGGSVLTSFFVPHEYILLTIFILFFIIDIIPLFTELSFYIYIKKEFEKILKEQTVTEVTILELLGDLISQRLTVDGFCCF